ncbi:MAG: hypothetical protein ACN4GM_02615 [Gammaproteobacteria bacterium]
MRKILLIPAMIFLLFACSSENEAITDDKQKNTDRIYNAEAVIPPQCYTKTEAHYNPCYTCHQSFEYGSRPNQIQDAGLQGQYTFTDTAQTNHWTNLFKDRRDVIAAISDDEVLNYINQDNYSALKARLQRQKWTGYLPDLTGFQLAAEAFDAQGIATDGSSWVAFNYKPLPSTFWPANGSTDDVVIRLPAIFRQDGSGSYNRNLYQANLAILEAAIKNLQQIDTVLLDETQFQQDLNNDKLLGRINTLQRPDYYLGAASAIAVTPFLYPQGTELMHSVRYVGVSESDDISNATRMKELRYMRKIRFYSREGLASRYDNERQERIDGQLPSYVSAGDWGLDNGFGWQILGFIEDAQGDLRPQSHEENMFCMGCHSTLGVTIDQTFSYARKLPGEAGAGYINLKGMADASTVGELEGEILRYLQRVGGGNEFRENNEILEKYFNADGTVNKAAVSAADVYDLITPSATRALELNKAYWTIVKEQSFIRGRDATVAPVTNVYSQVDMQSAPLPEQYQYHGDLRLDW